jgi:hypothetical protein
MLAGEQIIKGDVHDWSARAFDPMEPGQAMSNSFANTLQIIFGPSTKRLWLMGLRHARNQESFCVS